MSEESVIDTIKDHMGFRDSSNRCKYCDYFVQTNMGGKHSHCTLNPAIDVPVDEGCFCKYFNKTED